jgi:hypothetical protein
VVVVDDLCVLVAVVVVVVVAVDEDFLDQYMTVGRIESRIIIRDRAVVDKTKLGGIEPNGILVGGLDV